MNYIVIYNEVFTGKLLWFILKLTQKVATLQKTRKCIYYSALSSLFCIPLHLEMDSPFLMKCIIHKSCFLRVTRYIHRSQRINQFLLSCSPSFAFTYQLRLNFFFHFSVFQMESVASSFQSPSFL